MGVETTRSTSGKAPCTFGKVAEPAGLAAANYDHGVGEDSKRQAVWFLFGVEK